MGRQIGVIQSLEDQREMHELLASKYDILCLPRYGPSNPEVLRPGFTTSDEQVVLFGAAFLGCVRAAYQENMYERGQYLICAYEGLTIEWIRTTENETGATLPGRYYLQEVASAPEDCTKLLRRVYSFIVRRIKKTYPRRTDERHSDYFGPDFCRLMEQGKAKFGYDIPVVDT